MEKLIKLPFYYIFLDINQIIIEVIVQAVQEKSSEHFLSRWWVMHVCWVSGYWDSHSCDEIYLTISSQK